MKLCCNECTLRGWLIWATFRQSQPTLYGRNAGSPQYPGHFIKCQIPEDDSGDNWEKITNFEFEALQYCSLKTCECISSVKLIWFGSIQTLINNCLVQTLAINNCVVMSTTRPKIAIIHVLLHCDNRVYRGYLLSHVQEKFAETLHWWLSHVSDIQT